MIADLTTAWITLAADNSNLALAQDTMASAENSRRIVTRQMEVGTASAGDLSDAESVYQQARASVASYRTLVAQDKKRSTCWPEKPCRIACCPARWKALAIGVSPWCRRASLHRYYCAARISRKRA